MSESQPTDTTNRQASDEDLVTVEEEWKRTLEQYEDVDAQTAESTVALMNGDPALTLETPDGEETREILRENIQDLDLEEHLDIDGETEASLKDELQRILDEGFAGEYLGPSMAPREIAVNETTINVGQREPNPIDDDDRVGADVQIGNDVAGLGLGGGGGGNAGAVLGMAGAAQPHQPARARRSASDEEEISLEQKIANIVLNNIQRQIEETVGEPDEEILQLLVLMASGAITEYRKFAQHVLFPERSEVEQRQAYDWLIDDQVEEMVTDYLQRLQEEANGGQG